MASPHKRVATQPPTGPDLICLHSCQGCEPVEADIMKRSPCSSVSLRTLNTISKYSHFFLTDQPDYLQLLNLYSSSKCSMPFCFTAKSFPLYFSSPSHDAFYLYFLVLFPFQGESLGQCVSSGQRSSINHRFPVGFAVIPLFSFSTPLTCSAI